MSLSARPHEWALVAITVVTILTPLIILIKARLAGRELVPIFFFSLITTTGLTLLLEFLWYAISPVYQHPVALVSDKEAILTAYFFAFLSLMANVLLFGLAALKKRRACA